MLKYLRITQTAPNGDPARWKDGCNISIFVQDYSFRADPEPYIPELTHFSGV